AAVLLLTASLSLAVALAARLGAQPAPRPTPAAPPERDARLPPDKPGKGRLLFYRQGHLTLIDPDGKDAKQASKDRGEFMPGSACLSPDGNRIASLVQIEREPETDRDTRRKVYLRGLDEPEPGTDLGVEAQHVVWSPDGKQLIAVEPVHGNELKDLTFANW